MMVRIAKAIAARTAYSRREAERLIAEGRVSYAGERITHPATQVELDSPLLAVDGKPLPSVAAPEIWLLHKPTGMITTTKDPEGRPTVFSLLPPHLRHLMVVGRLDMQSEGLLLFTNSAAIKRHLEHPAHALERRYRVRVYGALDMAVYKQLQDGITLDGIYYRPVDISIISQTGRNIWLQFALKEGKNREIRMLCTALGVRVNRLIREAYGPFTLGKLPKSHYQQASQKYVDALWSTIL